MYYLTMNSSRIFIGVNLSHAVSCYNRLHNTNEYQMSSLPLIALEDRIRP